MTTLATLHRRPTAFASLFVRFMNGEIGDASWTRLMQIFDAGPATPEEREAFATFFSELLQEADTRDDSVPEEAEMEGLLQEIRPAA